MEGLSDRQAAEAVRSRIDWKYLLCLELTDTGFHYSVLSEYRKRLLDNGAEQRLLTRFLEICQDRGLLKERGQQRSDSTHVLGAIRHLNHLELVRESLRQVLNVLAVTAPEWALAHTDPAWGERYGKGLDAYRLPKKKTDLVHLAEEIGQDGLALLQTLWEETSYPWLRELPAVVTMRTIWIQNFTWREDGLLRWRTEKERPPAHLSIRSPFDP
jgi:transposase